MNVPQRIPLGEGQCTDCGRFGGRRRICPWCEAPVWHRVSLRRGRLEALLLLVGCLLLPGLSQWGPPGLAVAGREGRTTGDERTWDAPGTAPGAPAAASSAVLQPIPALALSRPRGALSGPVYGLGAIRRPFGLTRLAPALAAAALAAAALSAWLPVLHPYSLAAFGLMLWRGSGSAADWAFALACLLGAGLVWSGRGDGAAADVPDRGGGGAGWAIPRDAAGMPRRYWALATALMVLSAPLLLPLLRGLGLLFAPFRSLTAMFLLVALMVGEASRPGERLPLPGWRRLELWADRLLLIGAAGALGWAGAWTAGDATVQWSPHALSVTLAGLLALPALALRTPRNRRPEPVQGEGAGDGQADPVRRLRAGELWSPADDGRPGSGHLPAVPLVLGAAANLLLPVATAQVAQPVLWGGGWPARPADVARLRAFVWLMGFLLAALGGLGLPAGGGAWLADAAGLPNTRQVALGALLGAVLGGLSAAGLARGQTTKDPAAIPLRRPAPHALHYGAALLLALGTLGLSGMWLLLLAAGIGRLPARLAVDPITLAAVALLPLALGLPGVADPYPLLRGWLP